MTHEERFNQTIQTIESIKKHIPNCYIALIEGSKLNKEKEIILSNTGCNMIHNVSEKMANYINGPNKSLAEIHMIMDYLKTINLHEYATLNKISGRYYLTDNYQWERYPTSKALYQCDWIANCNRRYYRIPSQYFDVYVNTLQEALDSPDFVNGKFSIENYNIFRHMEDHISLMRENNVKLGVAGFVAPYGMVVED